MTARLILIAHAETNATRRATFPDGESLTLKGRKTAREQWMALPKRQISLSSPAPAALETASLAGLEAKVDDDLRELDVGGWRGRALGAIAASEPDAFASWIAETTYTGHGGESIATLIERTAAWLSARCEESGTIIAVTHAAVLRAALVAVMGAPASAFWRIDVQPMSMMTYSSDGRRWILREARY